MVVISLTRNSFQENVKEGWWGSTHFKLRLFFWASHRIGLHSRPWHAHFQRHVLCYISSQLPIRLHAIPCQRPSWNLWKHGGDGADAARISRSGSTDWIFALWCTFPLWNQLAPLRGSFQLFKMIFNMTLLGLLIRLMALQFWHSCKFIFSRSEISIDWVSVIVHFPVFQILRQTEVRKSIRTPHFACTNSAGLLSTPAFQPIFSTLTAAFTSFYRIGWCSPFVIHEQTSTPSSGAGGGEGGTLTLANYRDSDYFFGVQNFEFRYFLGVEILSTIFMGMPIWAGIYFGYDIFHRYLFGLSV